jgi:hypothetical protein
MPLFICPCKCATNYPIEGILILVASSIGIIVEVGAGLSLFHPILEHYSSEELKTSHHDPHKRSLTIDASNLQHTTMYSAFALLGLVEILVFYKCDLPKRTEYLSACIAYSIEALLFYFHLHGRNMLDIHVHILMVLAITGD